MQETHTHTKTNHGNRGTYTTSRYLTIRASCGYCRQLTALNPGLDHIKWTGKHRRQSSTHYPHQSPLEWIWVVARVITVDTNNDLSECEEGHVKGDIAVEGGFKAVIETSHSGVPHNVHKTLFLYVRQDHGTFGGTTWMLWSGGCTHAHS